MSDPTSILNYLQNLRLLQKPYPMTRQGLDYERRVKSVESQMTTNLLRLLPSTYGSDGAFPNYAIHLKTIAHELARIQVAMDQIADDGCFALTRSEFMWQVIGYMVFVDGRFPQGYSDQDFRQLLLDLIRIYFQGSTPKSMEEIVNLLYTGSETVTVTELFKEARIPGSPFDVHDTFKWRVDVGHNEFPDDLFRIDSDLRILIRIVKPAHTLYTLRHIFTDIFGEIVDELVQFDLCWYYYDDLRKNCDGWSGEDRLGNKENRTVTQEDHTADFGAWVPTTNLIVNTSRGPIVKPGTRTPADAAADVTVRVNAAVLPDVAIVSVNGLAGAVEIDFSYWSPGDTIDITYTWAPDPVYEMVLPDPDDPATLSFRLNEWHSSQNGRYLMSSTLAGYEAPEPEQVEWHYKAFERAYTASLNDPTSLLLNAPFHATTYPPFSRTSQVENVVYNANELPQNTVGSPWEQIGSGGTVAVSAGSLYLDDTSATGLGGEGDGLYFYRHLDQSFPNVFSMAARIQVQSVTQLHGVFTGVAFLVANDLKAIVVGLLDDGGTRKVGVLKAPGDEELISSWEAVDADWTGEQTFRFRRLEDGSVEFFLGGSATPSVSLALSSLPDLADLDIETPDRLMGVYWGSISRRAAASVRWEFLTYYFQPTQFTQSAQQIFSLFEGDELPQDAAVDPWLLVGSHGHERLVTIGTSIEALTVHDVSASNDAALVAASNLAGGEFRTYFHDEPIYEQLAWLVVDWRTRLDHATEEVTGVGWIADDGTRQIKVSFLLNESFRSLSYNGQTLPEDDPEADTVQAPGWMYSEVGAVSKEVVGRRLNISFAASETFSYDAKWTGAGATPGVYNSGPYITAGNDWQTECRLQVNSFVQSVNGDGPFQVYVNEAEDPTARNVILALRTNPGTGAEEVLLRTFNGGGFTDIALSSFAWGDGLPHDYRVVRNTSDANPANHTILLFVDGDLLLTTAYTSYDLSDNSTGVLNHLTFSQHETPVAVDFELEYLNLYNFDSDATATMWVGLELRQTLPTPFYGFQTQTTAFEKVAVDWTQFHDYRLIKDPSGCITLSIDGVVSLEVEYKNAFIPISPGLTDQTKATKFVSWGSFNSNGLSRSVWDHLRYRIFDGSEGIIAPHHMFLNQHNVIASYEHSATTLAHTDADQPFSSMGVPSDEFLTSDPLVAYTLLNEDTPPVPMTQEVELTTVSEPAHAINNPPDDILNDNPDFLLNDGTEITVTDETGQGGWDHWGDKSGLYRCGTFYDQHEGDQGLISIACDVYGLTQLMFDFSSACAELDMSADPSVDGFSFVSTGGGSYAVNFVSDYVRFQGGSTAYFTNQGVSSEMPNLLQGEGTDVSIEARIRITQYTNQRVRPVGFTFFDGVRMVQLTIGDLPGETFSDDQSAVVLSGVDGHRYVLWDDWTDLDWHTFKITKRAAEQHITLEIDGVLYPTATLPYEVAGMVNAGSWEPPYLEWGLGADLVGPEFEFPPGPPVILPGLPPPTIADFDYIEVCTDVSDYYDFTDADDLDGLEKMLAISGGRQETFVYGVGTASNVSGTLNSEYRLWGRLGVGHRAAVALDWREEETMDTPVEEPCREVSPGVYEGSCMELCFDYDSTEIGLLNNYPGYPDPLEPGNLLGPGAGIPDSTFWLGPLVTPAFPGVPVNPPAAGTCTHIALVAPAPAALLPTSGGWGSGGWGSGSWGGT